MNGIAKGSSSQNYLVLSLFNPGPKDSNILMI
jgi:hypothetical protein